MTDSHDDPRTVAFYLPQFHAIPENDEWWGEGFTEWTNVRRAVSRFAGHDHPRVPGDLGYYDLTDGEVMRRQVELARKAHVDAFCFYFYWFDGKRLLETPIESYRNSDLDLPYCLSWANEPWSRRWDGKAHHILMPQNYGHGFAANIFRDLVAHFLNDKYLRVDGRPVFVVHRVTDIPDARSVAEAWREMAREAGLPGLYLIAAETQPGIDPRIFGFDAAAEFPPVGSNTLGTALLRSPAALSPDFRGRLLSYERMARRFMRRKLPSYVLHRGVTPSWDNTARRGPNATIYVGGGPHSYGQWLRAARESERSQRGARGLVFVNAWNEWAEGAYLEPDRIHGDAFLRATRHDFVVSRNLNRPSGGGWSLAHARSIGLLAVGSAIARLRRVKAALRRRRRDR